MSVPEVKGGRHQYTHCSIYNTQAKNAKDISMFHTGISPDSEFRMRVETRIPVLSLLHNINTSS